MTFYTTNDRLDKSKYECYNNDTCTRGITYDDWHCSGCHWKGMGTSERKWSAEVEAKAQETANRLREHIFFKRAAEGKNESVDPKRST